MTVDAFGAQRQHDWEELEALLARRGRRDRALSPDDVLRLGSLYRATAADLALVRRRWPGTPAAVYLERLVARARPAVYTGRGRGGRLLDFVRRDYWRSVRERPAMLALAALLLFAPALLAGTWAWRDPERASGLVPSQYLTVTEPNRFDDRTGPSASDDTRLAAEIMTNNIRVTFLAFGGGLLLGVGTGFVLLQNGVLLGALAGLAIGAGNGSPFFELTVPHGLLELSCIVVAAAAGLRIAWAVIAPGYRSRGRALREEAGRAVLMVVGTAAWLVVAGLVEGYFTPARHGLGPALLVGFTLFVVFWSLVFVLGRPDREAAAAADADAASEAHNLADSFSFR